MTEFSPSANLSLVPGAYVRHPDREDWGLGQIQSVDGQRVTVNFEHAGKQLILIGIVHLISVRDHEVRGSD